MKRISHFIWILTLCAAAAPAQSQAPKRLKGVWLWASTLQQMGKTSASTVAGDLSRYGFTDIFMLVKSESGEVSYKSKLALAAKDGERDLLQEMTSEAHKRKLRLHAWFVINSDGAWGAKHPEDLMIHLKNGAVNGKISPLSPAYRNYISGLVKEVVDQYPVDGVHLDYIRYGHALYSFDSYVLDEAHKRRIDVEAVKGILNRSFYDPKDSSIIIKAYQAGDASLLAWDNLRREIIVGFAGNIRDIVKACRRHLYFSAALMPEGAYDTAFGDIYYAQNYRDAASLYDFVAPMAYWKDFSKPPEWVGTVVKGAVASLGKKPVFAGLQAFAVPGNRELETAERSAAANGSPGSVYFRYGSFAFASVRMKKNVVSFELQNRADSAVDRCEIDFKGTGFVADRAAHAPDGASCRVSENVIVVESAGLLARGETMTLSVQVRQSPIKAAQRLPSIRLSLKPETFVPVYAVMK